MRKRKITLDHARAKYVHRFTMEFVPNWSREPMEDGRHYAPQFASDQEWYDNTSFPGEDGWLGDKGHCTTRNQTWPLGKTLDKPFCMHEARNV